MVVVPPSMTAKSSAKARQSRAMHRREAGKAWSSSPIAGSPSPCGLPERIAQPSRGALAFARSSIANATPWPSPAWHAASRAIARNAGSGSKPSIEHKASSAKLASTAIFSRRWPAVRKARRELRRIGSDAAQARLHPERRIDQREVEGRHRVAALPRATPACGIRGCGCRSPPCRRSARTAAPRSPCRWRAWRSSAPCPRCLP